MKTQIKFLFIIILFLLFSAFENSVSACSCVYYGVPSCVTYNSSDVVFVGKITKFEKPDKKTIDESEGMPTQKVFFDVEHTLKGKQIPKIEVSTFFNTSCDYSDISIDQSWIVFANKDKNGKLFFGMCSGSFEIENQSTLDSILKELPPSPNEYHIFGRLEYGGYRDLKNIDVSADGFGQKFTSRTDVQGLYKISVPTKGKYKVRITFPYNAGLFEATGLQANQIFDSANESIFEYEVDLDKSNCVFRQFDVYKAPHLKATASISGKILNLKEINYFKPNLYLYRVGKSEGDTLNKLIDIQKINDDGSFTFSKLGKGEYVILMNEENIPKSYKPFYRTYIPNTNDFSSAQIIQLEEGQDYSNLSINLPKGLPVTKLTGKILTEKGKPITQILKRSDEALYFTIRQSDKPDDLVSNTSCDFNKNKFECYGEFEIDNQGRFSINALVGNEYLIEVEIIDKKDNNKHAFEFIKVEKNSDPLKIYINREGKADVNKYLKEPGFKKQKISY